MNDEELVRQARARFQEAEEAEREIRAEARKDLRFIGGKQWEERVRLERERSGRPALTFNRLPSYLHQVINDLRQSEVALQVLAVDNGADTETAEVIGGLFRHIETYSDGDIAYETAYDYSVSCGFGYYRISTDFVSEDSFDQEILIEAIPDPFCVYYDPQARRYDRADARFAFVVERMSREEFKRRWPNSEAVSTNFWDGDIHHTAGWITDSQVQVAEYWDVRTTPRKLLLLSSGETVIGGSRDAIERLRAAGVEVKRERVVHQRTVYSSLINGAEVLESERWPGKWIPIIPVLGKELIVDDERLLFSLTRHARDPQQLYNAYKTAQAEAVMIAPKAPYIGAEGQFEGHEREWETANRALHAYLEYKPTDLAGNPAPPPQRNNYEPPIQALSVGALQAADDIKATTGIFDASLGARSNETSGIAIQRRQVEGDTANFHFSDNLARSMRHSGRVILDLIPKIYDTERWVRIIGEDEAEKVIRVNALFQDDAGKEHRYDLGVGRYDVRISTGPSYTTKRQESFSMLTDFARAWPKLLEIGGDVVFRHWDAPGAAELAKRLKRTLPPNLLDEDDEDGQVDALRARLQAIEQQAQAMATELDQARAQADSKRMEIESKERIEAMKIQARLIETEAKLGSHEAIEMLRQEIAAVGRRLDLLNAGEPIADDEPPQAPPGDAAVLSGGPPGQL